MKKRGNLFVKRGLIVGSWLVFVLAAVITLYATFASPKTDNIVFFTENDSVPISDGWTYTAENGNTGVSSLPFLNAPVDAGPYTLSRKLPEQFPEDSVVYMAINYNNVTAYVGGHERTIGGVYNNRVFGSSMHERWGVIPLTRDDAGKLLTLHVMETYPQTGISLANIEIVNENYLAHRLFNERIPILILFSCMVTVALILCVRFCHAVQKPCLSVSTFDLSLTIHFAGRHMDVDRQPFFGLAFQL